MEKTEKEFLIAHRLELMQNLKYNSALAAYLEGNRLISTPDLEAIDVAFRNKGNQEAVFRLIDILITRPGSHAVLLDIAIQLNQYGAVEVLQKYEARGIDNGLLGTDVLDRQPVATNNNDLGGGMNKFDTTDNSEEENEMLDIINGKKKLIVKVEEPGPEESENIFDSNTSHILQPGHRGSALILNIVEFRQGCWNRRNGSDKDVKNLSKLLVRLGYDLYPKDKAMREREWKTVEEVKACIKEFREICNHSKPQSIIVFIGTHGFHPLQLTASDTSGLPSVPQPTLDLFEDVVQKFDHKRCPGLIGKPKIFLVQACQDFLPRYEEDSSRYIDDALIYTSGMPGETSYRDREKGSIFVSCFTYVMMKHAKDMSFQGIMEKVNDMLKLYKTAKNCEQVSMPFSFMEKKLYFSFEP